MTQTTHLTKCVKLGNPNQTKVDHQQGAHLHLHLKIVILTLTHSRLELQKVNRINRH
jgi:hypothetical protein